MSLMLGGLLGNTVVVGAVGAGVGAGAGRRGGLIQPASNSRLSQQYSLRDLTSRPRG
jgi:hypothetical protein